MGRGTDRALTVSRGWIPPSDGRTRRRGKRRRGASRVRAVPAASRGGARRVSVAGDRLDLPCTPGGTADIGSNDAGRRADRRTRQVRALASPDGGSTAPGGAGSRATVAKAPRSPSLCAHRRDRCRRGGSALGVRSRWKRKPRGRLRGRRLAGRLRRALGSPGRGHRRRRNTHGRRSRRRGVLGHERRRSHAVADRPWNERRRRDDSGWQRPERDCDRRRGGLGGQQPRRHGLADRPGHEHGRPEDRRRDRARRDRLRGRLGLGREHRRPNDYEDRPEERQAGQAASGRRDRARLRRRHLVGERACRGPGGSHRSDDREAGLRPDPRRERPDRDRVRRRRGVGGEQPGRDGLPDRSRHELRHRSRDHRGRARCGGRRRTRRLGEQPVRRRRRADRSQDEPGGAASERGKPPTGTGDVGRTPCSSPYVTWVPTIAAGRSCCARSGSSRAAPSTPSIPPFPATRTRFRSCG